MHGSKILIAGALALFATSASASPYAKPATIADAIRGAGVALVHHKPKHRGGPPPWARRGDDRPRYSATPAYSRVCRTEYRTRFDPYVGGYVREPVRTCREQRF